MSGAAGPASSSLRRAIIVCALGYFIDVFDIQLVAILRMPSLTELGVTADRMPTVAGYILNAQMFGMIIGAFFWGWLGDRFGRLKALYGSIMVYSVGTLACSLVHDPFTYGLLRFFTGLGLAGETGAAVTLVAELMSREKRGWGVTIIGGFGFLGPVAAVAIAWVLPWRMIYVVAGIFGILLLILRMRLVEPALFEKISDSENRRGSWRLLAQPRQALNFFFCVMLGLSLIYTWSLLNFFSVEFGHAILVKDQGFDQKICLMLFYLGTSCGDVICGALSQLLRSRRKAIAIFMLLGGGISLGYLMFGPQMKLTVAAFYAIYFIIGVSAGRWVLVSMVAAEQFGTNIRATTAIVITNTIRGFTVPMLFAFQGLRQVMSITDAAALIGAVFYALSFFALFRLRETHGLDLDYVERLENIPSPKTTI